MARARRAVEVDVGRAHDYVFIGQGKKRRVHQEVEVPRHVQDIYALRPDEGWDVGGTHAVGRVHFGEDETDEDVEEDEGENDGQRPAPPDARGRVQLLTHVGLKSRVPSA